MIVAKRSQQRLDAEGFEGGVLEGVKTVSLQSYRYTNTRKHERDLFHSHRQFRREVYGRGAGAKCEKYVQYEIEGIDDCRCVTC